LLGQSLHQDEFLGLVIDLLLQNLHPRRSLQIPAIKLQALIHGKSLLLDILIVFQQLVCHRRTIHTLLDLTMLLKPSHLKTKVPPK
jgi:hypothetical protein